MTAQELDALTVAADATVSDVMTCIDRNAKGVAFVLDADRRLVDTVTDGDLRRAVLARIELSASIAVVLQQKRAAGHNGPIVASVADDGAALLHLMTQYSIRHVPVVTSDRRLADAVFLDDLVKAQELPIAAVIMAGGFGTRLRPLTDEVPKPMLPVGGQPLLAHIIKQLSSAGVKHVKVATHYKGGMISDHFGDGSRFGVEIEYVAERLPLGTAGALRLVDAPGVPLLVMNGDVLTDVDIRAMLAFHQEHRADMTVAVREHDVQIPYGVIETRGSLITGIVEKPFVRQTISAGVYLINPNVQAGIPSDGPYDMPQLIERLVADGSRVVSFPVRDYWLDIGSPDDYRKAVADVKRRVAGQS